MDPSLPPANTSPSPANTSPSPENTSPSPEKPVNCLASPEILLQHLLQPRLRRKRSGLSSVFVLAYRWLFSCIG